MYQTVYERIAQLIFFVKGIRRSLTGRAVTNIIFGFLLVMVSVEMMGLGLHISQLELRTSGSTWPVALAGTLIQLVFVSLGAYGMILAVFGIIQIPSAVIDGYRHWRSLPLWRDRQITNSASA